MKIVWKLLILVIVALTIGGAVKQAKAEERVSTSGDLIIYGDIISSGGGFSSSTNLTMEGTIGEPVADVESMSDNFYNRAGFQNLEREPVMGFAILENIANLGELSASATATGNSTFKVMTNSDFGYSVRYYGNTLTNQGSDTIDPIGATAVTSQTGIEQFGINLKANTGFGAEPNGGSGAAYGQYAIADQFAFNASDKIAEYTSYTDWTVFTVSYIANIESSTEPGDYQTDITFIATGSY
ncbi:MAG: hypothetical protein GF332_02505 [Candidatus Moranbacteria bacterium]|nr:hypothetical protein [Candidatus Moranbacteria bacterium]